MDQKGKEALAEARVLGYVFSGRYPVQNAWHEECFHAGIPYIAVRSGWLEVDMPDRMSEWQMERIFDLLGDFGKNRNAVVSGGRSNIVFRQVRDSRDLAMAVLEILRGPTECTPEFQASRPPFWTWVRKHIPINCHILMEGLQEPGFDDFNTFSADINKEVGWVDERVWRQVRHLRRPLKRFKELLPSRIKHYWKVYAVGGVDIDTIKY